MAYFSRLLLLSLLFCLPVGGFASDFAGFLRAQGTQIVNDRGPIVLRGVNLGNWLFLEGYLFGAQAKGQQRQTGLLRSLGYLLKDPGRLREFERRWRENWITEQDIDDIARLGFNHVRVPLHRSLFIDPVTGQWTDEGFHWLDRLIEWCRPHGLYIIPDLHSAPGPQNSNQVSDANGRATFWTDYDEHLGRAQQLWQRIAQHYAHEPLIGGWDLLNEPEVKEDKWKLRDAQMNLTEAIRTVDHNHLVFAEGNWYATSFWELVPDPWHPHPLDRWDDNLAFEFHSYWSDLPNPSLTDQLRIAKGAGLPVWLGEFGENSNHWLARQVADMEDRHIGWSFWCYKKVESISTLVDVRLPDSFRRILNFWQGGPQPTRDQTWQGLEDLLEAVKHTNCLERTDVAAALGGRAFLHLTTPWRPHPLPAIIPASHYDLGADGLAYQDRDFQAASYPARAWNQGWNYRNDGVDLFPLGLGASVVGEIQADEWLAYTVKAPSGGVFVVSLRYASPTPSGRVALEINGNLSPAVNLPATGGWRTFSNHSLGEIRLAPGTQTLRLHFLAGGFDLSQLRILATP